MKQSMTVAAQYNKVLQMLMLFSMMLIRIVMDMKIALGTTKLTLVLTSAKFRLPYFLPIFRIEKLVIFHFF